MINRGYKETQWCVGKFRCAMTDTELCGYRPLRWTTGLEVAGVGLEPVKQWIECTEITQKWIH